MVNTMTPVTAPRLRPLDPDLPILAAQAAIELDGLRLGKVHECPAFRTLTELLKNSFVVDEENEPRKALLDAGTETLLSQSLLAARLKAPKTRYELAEEAWKLTNEMSHAEESEDKRLLEHVRDFCVALSRCAASYRESVHGKAPAPPYRRMGW